MGLKQSSAPTACEKRSISSRCSVPPGVSESSHMYAKAKERPDIFRPSPCFNSCGASKRRKDMSPLRSAAASSPHAGRPRSVHIGRWPGKYLSISAADTCFVHPKWFGEFRLNRPNRFIAKPKRDVQVRGLTFQTGGKLCLIVEGHDTCRKLQ